MKKVGILFWDFLKIGAFTFGGGYAMLALLEHELIDRKHWLTRQEFLDMIAISESTPRPHCHQQRNLFGLSYRRSKGSCHCYHCGIPSLPYHYLLHFSYVRSVFAAFPGKQFFSGHSGMCRLFDLFRRTAYGKNHGKK